MPNAVIETTAGTGTLIDTHATTSTRHREKIVESRYENIFSASSYAIRGRAGPYNIPTNNTEQTLAALYATPTYPNYILSLISVKVDFLQMSGNGTGTALVNSTCRLVRTTASGVTGGWAALPLSNTTIDSPVIGNVFFDSYADDIPTPTALTVTDSGVLTQEFLARMSSGGAPGSGYEWADSTRFNFDQQPIELASSASEGVGIKLYHPSTSIANAATNKYLVTMRWGVNSI